MGVQSNRPKRRKNRADRYERRRDAARDRKTWQCPHRPLRHPARMGPHRWTPDEADRDRLGLYNALSAAWARLARLLHQAPGDRRRLPARPTLAMVREVARGRGLDVPVEELAGAVMEVRQFEDLRRVSRPRG